MSIDATGRQAAEIADRIASYIDVLTVTRDADLAGAYYTEDAMLLGPGMNVDHAGVVEGVRAAFDAGITVEVKRETLELFVHGDTAYELAQAEDTFLNPDGTSNTLRNNMFIRWERGSDGAWRFARVLLSPKE